MGTTTDKLNGIINSKEAIRQSINNKGVTVTTGDTLASYASKIDSISTSYVWTAPADWIQLPTPANNEMLLLVSDTNPYYIFSVDATGGYNVDWGDGTQSLNVTTNTSVSHTYTIGAGQSCSRGYTTFKIRIWTVVAGNNLKRFYINDGNYKSPRSGYLWGKSNAVGMSNASNLFFSSGSYTAPYLEAFEFPSNASSCTSFANAFQACRALKYVKMPSSYATGVSFANMLNGCVSLTNFSFNVTSVNSNDMSTIFTSCSALSSVTLPTTVSGCTLMAQMFNGCTSLLSVTLPDINTNIQIDSMFNSCSAIRSISFPSSWNDRITNLTNTFYNCLNLESISLPSTIRTATFFNGTFYACGKLKSITIPSNSVTYTTFSNMTGFQFCLNLKEILNFPANVNSTTAASMFNNCYRLETISNLDTYYNTTSSMDFTSEFTGAYSLQSLNIRAKITGKFALVGISTTQRAALASLLFTNPGAVSTWAGASPQIDIAYCSLDATALNALFTSIIASSASFSGKTIRITGNPGAATCDTTIITNAGGIVNKTT